MILSKTEMLLKPPSWLLSLFGLTLHFYCFACPDKKHWSNRGFLWFPGTVDTEKKIIQVRPFETFDSFG